MEQYAIKGGNPLVGEVEIGGAKNAALAILAAAAMTEETVVIENVPDLRHSGNAGSHGKHRHQNREAGQTYSKD